MQHRFKKLATSSPAEFDYVIIGEGSAIAYRLGEDRDISVALIEYGGSDAGPFIQMPAALSYPMNMRLYDWGYRAVAEPAMNGRSLVCPRSKVIQDRKRGWVGFLKLELWFKKIISRQQNGTKCQPSKVIPKRKLL